MKIENKTKLTKDLLIRFSNANLYYKLKFNILIFPIMMISLAIVLNKQLGQAYNTNLIVIIIAIMVPIIIVGTSTLLLHRQLRNYSKLDEFVTTKFDKEGFYINPYKEEVKVSYDYIKECVEFNDFYGLYFKGAAPIVLNKNGFNAEGLEIFKDIMSTNIGKRFKFKKRKV